MKIIFNLFFMRYDVQTWYYFRRRVKRFLRGKMWPEYLPKSKTVLACGSSPEKAVPRIANWGLRYISIKTLYKNDNCLFRRHPRTPASCDTVVWIQPWTRNEKIGSKWVQTWMFGCQTFEFWEGTRQMWAHRSLKRSLASSLAIV